MINLTSLLKCTNEIIQDVLYALFLNISRFIIYWYSLVNEVLQSNTIVRQSFSVVLNSLICHLSGKKGLPLSSLGKFLKSNMANTEIGQWGNCHKYRTNQDINKCNSSIEISI